MQQAALEGLRKEIDIMLPRVKQVIRQTKARILGGDTHAEGKLFSIFEPSTENIRKGKAGKPKSTPGKMVKVQEAENQIVTSFEACCSAAASDALLIPAIEVHEQRTGRTPDLASADAGFYSAKNEAEAKQMGVKRVSVPNRSTKSAERRRYQKQRWFKKGQKWRTGCGRISVFNRSVRAELMLPQGGGRVTVCLGLGIIVDNLINISRAI